MLCLFFMISSVGYGQVHKMRTKAVAYRYVMEDKRWTDWSDFDDLSVLAVIDLDNERFTIHADEIQEYNVVEYKGKEVDSEGDEIISFRCVHADGDACGVDLLKLNSRDGDSQLYIRYADIEIAYYVYLLD